KPYISAAQYDALFCWHLPLQVHKMLSSSRRKHSCRSCSVDGNLFVCPFTASCCMYQGACLIDRYPVPADCMNIKPVFFFFDISNECQCFAVNVETMEFIFESAGIFRP